MSPNHVETLRSRLSVPIRPAGTLLLVRDGAQGIEVMTLMRSPNMRFLPGHIAFPGGAVDGNDTLFATPHGLVTVKAAEQPDDAVYAFAALRECAEEIGWSVALSGQGGENCDAMLPLAVHEKLLDSSLSYGDWLEESGTQVDYTKLRFVGRWVTPPTRPARFDTRFFVYDATGSDCRHWLPRVNQDENDWAQWHAAGWLLEQVNCGQVNAVPPTIAMLKAVAAYDTATECAERLSVPGPRLEE